MDLVMGIDVGSLTAKAVVLGRKGELLSYAILEMGIFSQEGGRTCAEEALLSANLKFGDIDYTVSTGYGRKTVAFANRSMTEISCHARGAYSIFPQARTVIDIGGQDSKVISLDSKGLISDFAFNDKCAAGTGRFLEVMSQALKVDLDRMGELSLQAHDKSCISSMCTVFAESEIISLLAQGHNKVHILASIHDAISRRLVAMVQRVGLRESVVMTGGVAKNIGVVRALENMLGVSILIPVEPQIVGALGAGLFALEEASLKSRSD